MEPIVGIAVLQPPVLRAKGAEHIHVCTAQFKGRALQPSVQCHDAPVEKERAALHDGIDGLQKYLYLWHVLLDALDDGPQICDDDILRYILIEVVHAPQYHYNIRFPVIYGLYPVQHVPGGITRHAQIHRIQPGIVFLQVAEVRDAVAEKDGPAVPIRKIVRIGRRAAKQPCRHIQTYQKQKNTHIQCAHAMHTSPAAPIWPAVFAILSAAPRRPPPRRPPH